MKHRVERRLWTLDLENTIEQSTNGDTIIVHSTTIKWLGLRIVERHFPSKDITFEIKEDIED